MLANEARVDRVVRICANLCGKGDGGMNTKAARAIWNQMAIPVVLNRKGKGQKIRVRLPFNQTNRFLLGRLGRIKPVWNHAERFWEVPKSWLNTLIKMLVSQHGRIYLMQTFIETEVCAPACRNAEGLDCSCSCGGANHGAGHDNRWFDISETFSFARGNEQLACRLLTAI